MSQREHLTIRWAFGMGQNAEIDFTRDELVKICGPIIDQAIAPIDAALVNKALSSMGLVSFGQDGEIVAYDPALHELADGMGSKGDSVVIRQCGWKIKGDVYKKAIVQKGE